MAHTMNYLTIAGYNDGKQIDSIIIEHPLYKHLEYLDGKNMLAAKDTVLQHAEFFVRLQAKGQLNTVRINEHIAGKPIKETIIKF